MATSVPAVNTSQVGQPVAKQKVELTPEQLKQKEQFRVTQLSRGLNFVVNSILSKSGEKIAVRAKKMLTADRQPPVVATNLFKFSMPSTQRGNRSKYYSYVCVNSESGQCSFEYFRPQKHTSLLWYFPLVHFMNGNNKNPERTLAKVGLTPAIDQLAAEFKPKGYEARMRTNRYCGCTEAVTGCGHCRLVSVFCTNPASASTPVDTVSLDSN